MACIQHRESDYDKRGRNATQRSEVRVAVPHFLRPVTHPHGQRLAHYRLSHSVSPVNGRKHVSSFEGSGAAGAHQPYLLVPEKPKGTQEPG